MPERGSPPGVGDGERLPLLVCMLQHDGPPGLFDQLHPWLTGEVRVWPVPAAIDTAGGDGLEQVARRVRGGLDGVPFALAGDGPGAALALRLADRLLPGHRAARLFLSGTFPPGTGPPAVPVPVTYFVRQEDAPAAAQVAWVGAAGGDVVVRVLGGSGPLPRARPDAYALALREDLGTWDPGHYVWRPPPLA